MDGEGGGGHSTRSALGCCKAFCRALSAHYQRSRPAGKQHCAGQRRESRSRCAVDSSSGTHHLSTMDASARGGGGAGKKKSKLREEA